jgi:uncharacterized protein
MEHKLTFKDYNAALKHNRLVALKCEGCGEVAVQPRLACCKCGSFDLSIVDLNGAGVIQTFTVMNVAPEGREAAVPYIVVLVALNEGPWIMGNLCGLAPTEASMNIIGKSVTMKETMTVSDKYSGGEVCGPVFAIIAS